MVTTNSGLTILRFCGQYLQMADTLRPVAAEVIKSLCSLYDIYIYAVFTFFTEHNFLGSDKLQATMKRIEESDLPLAGMSGFVDFTADNFWGLGNRVVAIESLFSISKQMENLRPLMENLIPENRILFFKKFYSVAVKGKRIPLGYDPYIGFPTRFFGGRITVVLIPIKLYRPSYFA